MIAREADLESAAEGGAVDRGHDGDRQFLEAPELILDARGALHELLDALRRDGNQILEIAAGEEDLLGRGDHYARQPLLGLQPLDDFAEIRAKFLVHRVHGTAHIHRDRHDAATMAAPR